VVTLWHAFQRPMEKPLDLAPRQPGGGGELIEGEGSLDILIHELCHLDQALVADADLGAQRHVLPVAVIAHPLHDELLGDQLRDLRAELGFHEMQHQIERRHSTGAGEAIVIDRKELIAEADAGKLLPQTRSYAASLVMMFAIRSGSTAFDSAIIEYRGRVRNANLLRGSATCRILRLPCLIATARDHQAGPEQVPSRESPRAGHPAPV